MVLMRGKVYKGFMGAFGACLLLAGCSSSQKPAALSPVGGTDNGSASTSASGSAGPTGATGSSSSATSAASSSSAAPAPTSVTTSGGGWAYSASVPGDNAIAAALTAFQNYASLSYEMAVTVEHNNDFVKYADGNVESLTNNFVTQERQHNWISRGTESIRVIGATKDNGTPPIVTITVCTDDTKLPMVSSYGPNKGRLVTPTPATPTIDIYKVHQGADGRWRVNAVTPKDTPC